MHSKDNSYTVCVIKSSAAAAKEALVPNNKCWVSETAHARNFRSFLCHRYIYCSSLLVKRYAKVIIWCS